MNTPATDSANARLVVLWWRGVWLSLLASFFSAVGLSIGSYHHPFPWTGALTGVMVGLSGYQMRLAASQFDRLDTKPAPGWMRPLGWGLIAVGATLVVLGAIAIAR